VRARALHITVTFLRQKSRKNSNSVLYL
jgi:hypothetical protein